jgi:hypothetical protein
MERFTARLSFMEPKCSLPYFVDETKEDNFRLECGTQGQGLVGKLG